ncbi:type II toxin-antitoxin system PemK/MazF family toxin [Desulfurobacterium atlanticum]|uniref:type II toxin-antitoxin system PemK/MazF family toxin n=1 Tax=Desulfurobacterium atlanticum TaxID=240169 RepID=UPI000B787911|nr:type II toxin-antitoxin system PemK/MazF family toxin [Desulfurobacterium atlanticum]
MEKKSGKYIPERGDILWLYFSPQAGHEQAGKRPAICLSPKLYNEKTNLGLFCPIEVSLPANCPVRGVILADQIRNLDWNIRKVSFIARVSEDTLERVLEKIQLLLFY